MAMVIQSPYPIPAIEEGQLKIFLGGSIDMGNADNWQAQVADALANEDFLLMNPRRQDWNNDWKPLASDPNFKLQVEWELNALESADVIIMNFTPDSLSPISLLELGLHAQSGKLMVVCPEGFWRKGNVDVVCARYNIPMYNDIDELLAVLKRLGNGLD